MACLEGCTISPGGTLYGNVGWDLAQHPNTTGEHVVATVTVTSPADFNDADTSNNTATSAQSINIVNEEPDPAPDICRQVGRSLRDFCRNRGDGQFHRHVKNEGDADAETDTTVTLHLGDDTAALDSATVTALAAGAEGTATLAWDTDGAKSGEHTLRALAQTEGDGNADNDSKTVTVTLEEPSVDVAVKSVTASATEAVVGDTVDFTVTLETTATLWRRGPKCRCSTRRRRRCRTPGVRDRRHHRRRRRSHRNHLMGYERCRSPRVQPARGRRSRR